MSVLNQALLVDADRTEYFREHGHVRVDGTLDAQDLEPYTQAIASEVERLRSNSAALDQRSTYGKAFLQLHNLWIRNDFIAQYVLAPRFAGVAAQLLGVERVRLYHDQALFKEPGGGHTPWHQDALYWPLDGSKCITMWMALDTLSSDMGLMSFADGSHRSGALSELHISDESHLDFERVLADGRFDLTAGSAMRPGDATFHQGWTVHRADANTSTSMRAAMTIIWFADGEVVQEPRNPAQERDRTQWLPGCEVGAEAASDLNPVIPVPVG